FAGGYFSGAWEGNLSGTWEWEGGNWTQRAPTTNPPGRRLHAMAYDAARERVVLFGGEDLTHIRQFLEMVLSDTWLWDGSNWTQAITPHPLARDRHAMAYDLVRQRVVMFGGSDNYTNFSDTWEWDGTIWRQRSPATNPGARVN